MVRLGLVLNIAATDFRLTRLVAIVVSMVRIHACPDQQTGRAV